MTAPEPSRRTMPLARRLRASLVLLTLVPLVLVGGAALFLVLGALSRSVSSVGRELDRLSQVSAAISGYVQTRELALKGLAELAPLPTMSREQRRILMKRTRESAEGLALLGYYARDAERDEVLSPDLPLRGLDSGEDTSVEARHREAVEAALDGRAVRSRVVRVESGRTLLILGHPVSREGRVVGALVAWVDLEPALEILRQDCRDARLAVWLVEGRSILAAAGTTSEVQGGGPDLSTGQGARLVDSPRGESVLEGSLPVSLPGWRLIWAYPLPEVDQTFRVLAVQGAIVILSAAGLAWLLGGVLARRIASPLEALSASALAIAGGDYEAKAADPGRYRELEVLTGSFETMRNNLVRTLGENERLIQYTRGLLRARVEELQVLCNLSEASAGRGDAQSLADLLPEHIRHLLPDSAVALWLRDGEGRLCLQALVGLTETERAGLPPPPLERLPGGGGALQEYSVVRPPAGEVARHALVAGRFPGRVVGSYCLVSLSVRENLFGVLEVLLPEGADLEDASVELLRAMGREVGLALENARLYARSMAEKRFHEAVLVEMGDGVLTLDASGRITTFNRAAERISGWDRRDVLGRRVDEVFRMAEAEHPLARLVQAGASVAPFEVELVLPVGGRKVLLFNPTVPPAVDEAGEGPSAIVVFRDISRIRELEDLRRDFTATISHELRTPLTAIKGYLATLMHPRARFDGDELNRCLGIINHQVDHLNRLIADLLEAARLRNAALEVHPRRVDLLEVLRTRVEAAEHGPEQSLRLEGEGPVWGWCDPGHLGYVVDHLLSNAVKYSLPRGEVVVSAVAEPGRVRVAVQDFGVGIPLDQQERIFEMYHRVELGDTRIHYGIGVGLFIARRIVEAHGGALTVESRPGVGSTFTLTLPPAGPEELDLGR